MNKLTFTLAAALLVAVGAIGAAPSTAAAQCTYGCACEGGSCGCNSNGNGGRCDASGSGCVVKACNAELEPITFAPDGSIVRFASATRGGTDPAPEASPELGGATRWEFVSGGHSVARHCSGVVVGRYYDPKTAAALREKDRTLTL